jgi:protein-S-isoprenylcysteine O-methyltransferase Ste14
MRIRAKTPAATLVFFAFTAPLGIAAHLISELAGLGWHDDADVILSARHAYLALIAVVAFGALLLAMRGVPREDRRRRIAEIVDNLPFRGRGWSFAVLSFAAQFAFFAITQVGEGCPLCSGDVFTGVIAAAFAAALGAIAIAIGKRRILEFVLGLVGIFVGMERPRPCSDFTRGLRSPVRTVRRTPFSFRYRPPPIAQLG